MSEDQVKLEFPSFQEFLRRCAPFISEEGLFLRTDQIRAVGSRVGFDVGLGPDFPILRGTGEVVWVVEPDAEGIGAPGMALRYVHIDDATDRLIRKISERQREQAGEVFSLARPDEPVATTAATGEGLADLPEALLVDEASTAGEAAAELPATEPGGEGAAADSEAPTAEMPTEMFTPDMPAERPSIDMPVERPSAELPVESPALETPAVEVPTAEVPAAEVSGDELSVEPPVAGQAPETEEAPAPADEVLSIPDEDADAEASPAAASAVPPATPEPALPPESEPGPEPGPGPGWQSVAAASERRRSGGLTLLWVALAAIAVGALGYWQRDLLSGLIGGGEASAPAAVSEPQEPADPAGEAAAAGAEVEPEPDPGAQPVAQAPSPAEVRETAVIDEPAAEVETPEASAGLPRRSPLTRIDDISWLAGRGSTLLMLRADGTFGEDSYVVERIGGESPRAVLKISGVTAPYEAGTAEVGTAEVARVRTGLHPTGLHVVLDLASPDARVTSAEVDGVVLRVRVTSGSR